MWFWVVRRHVAESVEWFDRVLAADGGSPQARAAALIHGGFVTTMIQYEDLDGCLAQVREGLSLFRTAGRRARVKYSPDLRNRDTVVAEGP